MLALNRPLLSRECMLMNVLKALASIVYIFSLLVFFIEDDKSTLHSKWNSLSIVKPSP
jgi:hypothetical protein